MAQFLTNAWYVAAFADELSADAMLARTILGERIAFFLDEAGQPTALRDQCPHRFAQLHNGTLDHGIVECPYHGLRFNAAGACVHNPHGDGAIPERVRVKTYPLHLQYQIVWIWMGEARLADPAKVPDLSTIRLDIPEAVNRGYMHTPSNYELVTDNLMDLSHADYVHRESLNTGGSLSRLRPQVKPTADGVEAYWSYQTDTVQPFFASAVDDPSRPVVQSFHMVWHAPSNLVLRVTARNADEPPEADNDHITGHLLTPETDTSTHYFVIGARSWDVHNVAFRDFSTAALMAAFTDEDKPMLHDVQQSMGTIDLWSLKPLLLSCDIGPVQARRMLARLIKDEQEQSQLAAE